MVLDLESFRSDKGGNPDAIRENEKKRFGNVAYVDQVIEMDTKWRENRFKLDQLNKFKNKISKQYGQKMKELKGKATGDDGDSTRVKNCLEDYSTLEAEIEKISAEYELRDLKSLRTQVEEVTLRTNKTMVELEEQRGAVMREIGNILHPDCPVSDDEENNVVIRTFGTNHSDETKGFPLLLHIDLIQKIGGMDTEHGSDIAGSRGYFLKGPGVFLQQALIQYALQFLADKDYEALYTPFWMRKSLMGAVAQLNQFDDELYKVVSSAHHEDPEEKYLIATSEQPICAVHRGEWMAPSSLPIKYAGVSTCFRQEVGSHGRDTRGIFRVHQFEKVEQFVICNPADSWNHFHEMIANSEDFYKSLGISYQVISIVSGALNHAAAMKYDLEAWFPGSKAFRELVSVSNCTDYQSRRLQIRFGQTKKMDGPVEFVHMLNGTMCAVTRVICVILETHQTQEGINIPEVLQRFMPNKYKTFIPFIN